MTAMERFLASFRRESSGCWIWTKSRNTPGYGMLFVDGKYRLAHRWAYEALVREIPTGMVVDHLCRNRSCVNPQHLDIVTNRENVLRGMSPSAVVRRQGVCRRGHAMVGENVYVPPKRPEHQQCRTCRAQWSANRKAAS